MNLKIFFTLAIFIYIDTYLYLYIPLNCYLLPILFLKTSSLSFKKDKKEVKKDIDDENIFIKLIKNMIININ